MTVGQVASFVNKQICSDYSWTFQLSVFAFGSLQNNAFARLGGLQHMFVGSFGTLTRLTLSERKFLFHCFHSVFTAIFSTGMHLTK
jgi:hypothetical protein